MTMLQKIADRIIAVSTKRPPDFIVGGWRNPYLLRWYLIPRNRFFNVYLHQFLRSDDDRALHDHPWVNCSILLRSGYIEMLPDAGPAKYRPVNRYAGNIVFRRAKSSHCVQLLHDFRQLPTDFENGSPFADVLRALPMMPCWTLFITGPVIRDWGFHCPHGWVHHEDFSDPAHPGSIGKGCNQ